MYGVSGDSGTLAIAREWDEHKNENCFDCARLGGVASGHRRQSADCNQLSQGSGKFIADLWQFRGARRSNMRMMMTVEFPIEPFNAGVRNGTAGSKMMKILDELKPEAAYFGSQNGKRGGILIVDVAKPSDIPRLAEPWFLNFNAEVKFSVVMTPEDLVEADLLTLGKKWG
jgi:hypothetical protein